MNVESEDMEPNELPDFLAGIRHITTYKVPPQYFEALAEDILGKVHLPVTSAVPFSAPPTGYFDNLADSILQKVKSTPKSEMQQELEEIEPFLASLSKTNPYAVPQGYFDTFKVPLKTPKVTAPVLQISRRPKWITYAAAAVIACVVTIGAVLFLDKSDAALSSANYEAALAKVSDNDLNDYLDNSASDIDVIPASNGSIINSNGLYEQLLNDASDNDIQQYLNENNDGDEKNSTGI